jgi:hypothetical protein
MPHKHEIKIVHLFFDKHFLHATSQNGGGLAQFVVAQESLTVVRPIGCNATDMQPSLWPGRGNGIADSKILWNQV